MKPQKEIKIGDIVFFQRANGNIDAGFVYDIGEDGCINVKSCTGLYEFPNSSYLYTHLRDVPSRVEICGEKRLEKDPTNPNYYKSGKYEIYDVLMDWIEAEKLDSVEAVNIFNTVKYLRRFKSKHPEDSTVDLKKAKWYLEKLIDYGEKKLKRQAVSDHLYV